MLESFLHTPGAALRYLVDHDAFVVVPPLSASAFVTFCKDREIDIDLERLERFERLGIFFPLARVEYPRIKVKVERVGVDRVRFHGMVKDGETWDGELREENSRFSWRRDWATSWVEEGALWDPRERPFEAWSSFRRTDSWEPRIESFYSPFQAFVLHSLLPWITMRVPADIAVDWSSSEVEKFGTTLMDWSTKVIAGVRNGLRSEDAALIAQAIANRYYFHTRGDRRTIRVSEDPFEEWDWRAFARAWNAPAVAAELGLTYKAIADIHLDVSFLATSADPIERWFELVSFIPLEKREQLKDEAKFAQFGYSIEHMLRLFYRDVTDKDLRPPHERHAGIRVEETQDRDSLLKELEYVVNEFHLSPKPKLILVVEGDGEAVELPRLALDLLGYDFAQLAIEVLNLHGIPNFTGAKRRDPYGALEKFIDDHHYRQTIVLCILDREGRAQQTKERLVSADSQFVPGRKLTCEEYIYLWNDSIEFDNFSDQEIAEALTRVSEDRYTFTDSEVAVARSAKTTIGNPLNGLYHDRLSYELNKVRLLHELFNAMIASAPREHAANPQRPIVSVLYRVIKLAADNHQPVNADLWRHNQETGYFGPVNAASNPKA